jgi:hypothetical protein
LNQFQVPPKPSNSGQQQTTSAPQRTEHKPADNLSGLPPELAAELAAGMEEMFKNLGMAEGTSSGKDSVPGGKQGLDANQPSEQDKAFRKLWEDMLVDGMDGKEDSKAGDELDAMFRDAMNNSGAKKADPSSSSKGPQGGSDAFQDAIRQTMEKLKSSDETVTVG